MTFIASVVARDGVAIIADSLVTTAKYVIELGEFVDYALTKFNGDNNATLEINELYGLFNVKSSHTRDFEDKIFDYDLFTAITTAGSAEINGKRIRQLVAEKKAINEGQNGFNTLPIEDKVLDFCNFIEDQIRQCVTNDEYQIISSTTFIFTHFDPNTSETTICKIETQECSADNFSDPDFKAVMAPYWDSEKVVCDGQNRISNGILYGGVDAVFMSAEKTIEMMTNKYQLDSKVVDGDRIHIYEECEKLINESNQLRKISDLSLQQAVDLAALLMRIEIDFQKYTADIPTVGGVVKIATINHKGFQFITGNEIIRPSLM